MIVTKEKFVTIGMALFGARWKTDMALALELSVGTIHDYADGTTNVPRDVRKKIAILAYSRGSALERIAVELDQDVRANFRNS